MDNYLLQSCAVVSIDPKNDNSTTTTTTCYNNATMEGKFDALSTVNTFWMKSSIRKKIERYFLLTFDNIASGGTVCHTAKVGTSSEPKI